MKKLAIILFVLMMAFCTVAYAVNGSNDDLSCRLTKIENGKIMAEVWKNDRYYYVVEFPAVEESQAKTCVYDAYMNYYFGINMGGLMWDAEQSDLIIVRDEDWEAQEEVYHHEGDYILIGKIGCDADIEYSITLDWIISQ